MKPPQCFLLCWQLRLPPATRYQNTGLNEGSLIKQGAVGVGKGPCGFDPLIYAEAASWAFSSCEFPGVEPGKVQLSAALCLRT